MMRKIYYTYIVFMTCMLVCACQQPVTRTAGKRIQVSTASYSAVEDVVKCQEIVELSRENEALMGRLDNTQVYDDFYLFRDNKDILYLFRKDGTFVSNSRRVQGRGKGEYTLCLACSYNEHSQNIEIVTPDGILFYDHHFDFIRKARFKDDESKSLMFNSVSDLTSCQHILFSPLENGEKKAFCYVYDSQKEKLVKAIEYPRHCGLITMQQQCVSDHGFIAFPCLNYVFFTIDPETFNCLASVELDFGKKTLRMEDVDGKNPIGERQQYLLDCNSAMPLRTYKSGETMVTLIKEGPKRSDFKTAIIDLKTGQYKLLQYDNGQARFPIMDFFADNIIYACVPSEEIGDYVAETLIDGKSTDILSMQSDQSNYYMIKYHLK